MNYTKYEKARIIGARALQIAMGAPFLLNLTKEDLDRIKYNPIEIAKTEFDKGIIPITVKRFLPKPEEEAHRKAAVLDVIKDTEPDNKHDIEQNLETGE